LHGHIANIPALDLKLAMSGPVAEGQRLDAQRWEALSQLEQYTLQRRYHQANVLLMARVWTQYLGFVTGMISMLIGAIFILGKLQEASSNFSGEAPGWKFAIATSSPGLVLALLGTILMVTTLVTPSRIDVEDTATFVTHWNPVGHALQLSGESPEELLKNVGPVENSPKPAK